MEGLEFLVVIAIFTWCGAFAGYQWGKWRGFKVKKQTVDIRTVCKTKLSLDQRCYFIMLNNVYEAIVKEVITHADINSYFVISSVVTYVIDKNPAGSQYTTRFNESDLFASKQDLLNSL